MQEAQEARQQSRETHKQLQEAQTQVAEARREIQDMKAALSNAINEGRLRSPVSSTAPHGGDALEVCMEDGIEEAPVALADDLDEECFSMEDEWDKGDTGEDDTEEENRCPSPDGNSIQQNKPEMLTYV